LPGRGACVAANAVTANVVAANVVAVSRAGVALGDDAAILHWNNASSGNPLLLLNWSAVRQLPKGSSCRQWGGSR
jgi:hypothetical protein